MAAKVERRGRQTVLVNGKPYKRDFEQVWEPIFSPDAAKVLIRARDGGKYLRIVADVADF